MPFLILAALVVSPAAAWFIWARLTCTRVPAIAARGPVGVLVVATSIALVCTYSPWSLRGQDGDIAVALIGYLAFGVCGVAAWSIRSTVLRWTVGLFTALVLTAGVMAGPLLFFGSVLLLDAPCEQGILGPNIRYRVDTFGGATTRNGGYIVRLITTPRWAPFLEREIWRGRYDDAETDLTGFAVAREASEGRARFVVRTRVALLDSVSLP